MVLGNRSDQVKTAQYLRDNGQARSYLARTRGDPIYQPSRPARTHESFPPPPGGAAGLDRSKRRLVLRRGRIDIKRKFPSCMELRDSGP